MKKIKTPVEHKDCLGRLLKIGDCVAFAHHNMLIVGTVKKFHEKMITVAEFNRSSYHKYSKECALLEGSEVTMFLLKGSQ